MKFEKFLASVKSNLEKEGFKSLAIKINHPSSKFNISLSSDYEVIIEYPDKEGYPQEEYFILSESGVRKVANFLKEKYISFIRS